MAFSFSARSTCLFSLFIWSTFLIPNCKPKLLIWLTIDLTDICSIYTIVALSVSFCILEKWCLHGFELFLFAWSMDMLTFFLSTLDRFNYSPVVGLISWEMSHSFLFLLPWALPPPWESSPKGFLLTLFELNWPSLGTPSSFYSSFSLKEILDAFKLSWLNVLIRLSLFSLSSSFSFE